MWGGEFIRSFQCRRICGSQTDTKSYLRFRNSTKKHTNHPNRFLSTNLTRATKFALTLATLATWVGLQTGHYSGTVFSLR